MAIDLADPPVATTPARTVVASFAAPRASRIHYLDNLRALAMLLGVVLHGSFAYAYPSQTFWLATDAQSSSLIDAAIWFIHLFRLPLFFFLSGYFAKLVLVRNDWKRTVSRRALRLAVPFLLFYLPLWAAMGLVIAFGLTYIEKPLGLMGVIADAQRQDPTPATPAPGTMHLWFLYYLIFFTLVGVLGSRVRLPQVDFPMRPWILAIAPLALVPAVIAAGVPLPGPESFIPTWWPFAFYGLFFWTGWQWYGREQSLEHLRPYVTYILGGSMLLFVPYYLTMPVLDLRSLLDNPVPQPLWMQAIGCICTAYLSVTLTVASLLLGRQFLSNEWGPLKLLADSSYWVYLVHLPIVLFLQTLLIPWEASLWIKLGLTLAATMAFCLATYLVFVRYTAVGWILHGRRAFP